MIDCTIIKIEEGGRSGPRQTRYFQSTFGKETVRFAEAIYFKEAPKFRDRRGTMIGDVHLIDVNVVSAVVAKIVYCLNSDGGLKIIISGKSIEFSFSQESIRFVISDPVPQRFYDDASTYKKVKAAYQNYIQEKPISLIRSGKTTFVTLPFPNDKKRKKELFFYIDPSGKEYLVTKTERNILEIYSNDKKQSNTEIAELTGYSTSTVSKTLASLKIKGVIPN